VKVLIINQHSLNRGDEAAARALYSFLDEDAGISRIDVLYNVADMDRSEYLILSGLQKPWDHHSSHEPSLVEKALILLTFILPFPLVQFLFRTLSERFHSEIALVESSDVAVNAPGGVNIGPYRGWMYLWRLYVALKLQKPVAIYSISFGPLPRNIIFRRASLHVLRGVKFLSLRDRRSQEYAREYQIPFQPAIDTAFLDRHPMDSLPAELEYMEAQPYVVMVPNQLHEWHPNFGHVPPERADALYVAIVDCILEQDVRVVLLPQLFGRQNDSRYFESIRSKCRDKERVFCIEDKYDSFVQQRIIRSAQFLIGARYHSVVFAIRNHTPFIALSYEHKIEEMLSILDLSDCSIDLTELLSHDNIDGPIGRVRQAYATRISTRPRVEAAEKQARRIALDTFECFQREFLNSTGTAEVKPTA
jgi:colanic acid/amylovoran biosynthesis protein